LKSFIKRVFYLCVSYLLFSIILFLLFKSIFTATSLVFPYALNPFDICESYPKIWDTIKKLYFVFFFFSYCIIFNNTYSSLIKYSYFDKSNKNTDIINTGLNLLVGYSNSLPVYICEKGLYQNILITGTIGTGKTSSAMYPFTKQIMQYEANNQNQKIAMLILDVKGNYFQEVLKYADDLNRLNDIISIDLSGRFKYNPLDKPYLQPIVLANRLKTILTIFSPNNSESYWLDVSEQILAECIKFCRLYNNNYVSFSEIHKLIMFPEYYHEKIKVVKELFQKGDFNNTQVYNLLSCIDFFEKEFYSLDSRTIAILKSEISRITNIFISDYAVSQTFCPSKEEINFHGFENVLDNGKIVVLNMNIAEYKNLSKIIAAYLKLDFQTEVLSRLGNNKSIRKSAFISDEYSEYVTRNRFRFFLSVQRSQMYKYCCNSKLLFY